MAIPITVPRLGWSIDEGSFVEWLRKDGDRIEIGDELFVLENEKALQNIEAIDSGILCIPTDSPKPGDAVKVGQVLAFLVSEGEALPAKGTTEGAARDKISAVDDRATSADRGTARAVKAASPRARRLARELGIDWTALTGSGRNGRVRERDVQATTRRSPRSE